MKPFSSTLGRIESEVGITIVLPPLNMRKSRHRDRALSCPPQMNEKLQQRLKSFNRKMKRKKSGGGEQVSEITQEFRKAHGKAQNLLVENRRRQESDARAFKNEMKKRQALFNISRMKTDHEFNKKMYVREHSEKTTAFEETVEERFGEDLAQIYKIKLGDRFQLGSDFGREMSYRDIKSIEEYNYLVSDSTSTEEEESEEEDESRNPYASPFMNKNPSNARKTNLPRVRADSELPFSPLAKKSFYFPKIEKKQRKRSNVNHKEFDVDRYLRSRIFSKRNFKNAAYSSSDEEDVIHSNYAKKTKPRLNIRKLDEHTLKMNEYEAQLYSLVNSPRGSVNKEIEDIKKRREEERQNEEKSKAMKVLKSEKVKFEDHLDEIILKCKGCLKAYLFMNHLYETFLHNKREERRLDELVRDGKSLKFQKMFTAKFEEENRESNKFYGTLMEKRRKKDGGGGKTKKKKKRKRLKKKTPAYKRKFMDQVKKDMKGIGSD